MSKLEMPRIQFPGSYQQSMVHQIPQKKNSIQFCYKHTYTQYCIYTLSVDLTFRLCKNFGCSFNTKEFAVQPEILIV